MNTPDWKIIAAADSPLHTGFSAKLAVELMTAAREVKARAYSPYSQFQVGAAVVMTDSSGDRGEVYSGCNVENASYGATMCAERNAVFAAVAAGGRKITALALTLDSAGEGDLSLRTPCGLCRQVISEFADNSTAVIIDSGEKDGTKYTGEVMGIAELLPWGFHFED